MKKITEYLGGDVGVLLKDEPFSEWGVTRTEENELEPPIVYYVFPEKGLALQCGVDERISVIFLRSREGGSFDGELISPDLSFAWSREQVLQHLGCPSKSGPKGVRPYLGAYGAWDRFDGASCVIHVEYSVDADRVNEITLMTPDIVAGLT
jgi:hypothetical protein